MSDTSDKDTRKERLCICGDLEPFEPLEVCAECGDYKQQGKPHAWVAEEAAS